MSNSNLVHIKTPCASAVLRFFGVTGVTWNTRTKRNVWDNTLRRAGFSLRSRMSQLNKSEKTVSRAKAKMIKLAKADNSILAFIVTVRGHVLLINRLGNVIVDTSPRRSDRRPVLRLIAVFKG